jgi:sugar phosphate permease
MLVLGQAVIALGLLAASLATSFGTFTMLLIGAGVGYGMLNPTSTKAVMGWSPPAHRATLVGLKQVGLPLGGMLGAALSAELRLRCRRHRLEWRAAHVDAELAGPRHAGTAVGLGVAVSSAGVTLGPLVFGLSCRWLAAIEARGSAWH